MENDMMTGGKEARVRQSMCACVCVGGIWYFEINRRSNGYISQRFNTKHFEEKKRACLHIRGDM